MGVEMLFKPLGVTTSATTYEVSTSSLLLLFLLAVLIVLFVSFLFYLIYWSDSTHNYSKGYNPPPEIIPKPPTPTPPPPPKKYF